MEILFKTAADSVTMEYNDRDYTIVEYFQGRL